MRRAATAAAVLAIPLAAAACGSSAKKTTTAATTPAALGATVQAAVAKTAKAGSEHVVVTAKVATGGQSVSLAGHGDFDTAKRLGSMQASFSLGGASVALQEVQSGTTIYVSSPFFAAMLPSGKSWLKLDLASAAKTLGANASALTAQDPSSALAQLEALTGVTQVGSQLVAGVSTTHYRGTIDVAKLPAASSALVKSTGATFGPVDVWVGDDGYVHRVRVTTTASAGGQSTKTTLTMTLSDFGLGVIATVPPASQTEDASKVQIPGLTG
jgi:LppX_LprAFG lipoprotein